ncbi:hypothetical protein CERSUDRAFT_115418 [Gelatoporia subvermispora B]|uniref:FHA domain-containing protein n=1 Tax=Ceriporiopsis subvermispora (strain B) TaxID=914234 RepID=M2PJP0_CERS8|nr:hypothetical protein CERSUDRAFT_115418 [Gelatoporia subvermispora B]
MDNRDSLRGLEIDEDIPVEEWSPNDFTDTESLGSSGTVVQDAKICTIRFKPDPASPDALQFEPIVRDLNVGQKRRRIGRYFTKHGDIGLAANSRTERRITFMSMVVSRIHAEIWAEENGKVYIKDAKSTSGTFVRNKRLSPEGSEPPTELSNGDMLQLGTPYMLGNESFHRCVKAIIEIERVEATEGSSDDESDHIEPTDAETDVPVVSGIVVTQEQSEHVPIRALPTAQSTNLNDFLDCRPPPDTCDITEPEELPPAIAVPGRLKSLRLRVARQWQSHFSLLEHTTRPGSRRDQSPLQLPPSSDQPAPAADIHQPDDRSSSRSPVLDEKATASSFSSKSTSPGRSTSFVKASAAYGRAVLRHAKVPGEQDDTHHVRSCCCC